MVDSQINSVNPEMLLKKVAGAQRPPFASITWIRFNGSAALPRRPLSL
jgi:hypothetical protein